MIIILIFFIIITIIITVVFIIIIIITAIIIIFCIYSFILTSVSQSRAKDRLNNNFLIKESRKIPLLLAGALLTPKTGNGT